MPEYYLAAWTSSGYSGFRPDDRQDPRHRQRDRPEYAGAAARTRRAPSRRCRCCPALRYVILRTPQDNRLRLLGCARKKAKRQGYRSRTRRKTNVHDGPRNPNARARRMRKAGRSSRTPDRKDQETHQRVKELGTGICGPRANIPASVSERERHGRKNRSGKIGDP